MYPDTYVYSRRAFSPLNILFDKTIFSAINAVKYAYARRMDANDIHKYREIFWPVCTAASGFSINGSAI